MSLLHPTQARLCNACGNAWFAQARYSPLKPGAILFNAGQNAALAHSRNKYEQHKFCPRCGSDKVDTVRGQGFVPTAAQYGQASAAPVNVNVNVNTGSGTASFNQAAEGPPSRPVPPAYRPPLVFATVPPPPPSAKWWKSPRFWFLAMPLLTGGLASWVPPLWVASKVQDAQLKARLYAAATAAAVLALTGGGLVGSAPEDALGNASGPRADLGAAIMLVAIGIGTWTAFVHRQRVFPRSQTALAAGAEQGGGPPLLPGVQEAQVRRQRRAQYRGLASEDVALAREMNLGRPDRTPAFDDGGLVDLNALDAAALEQHARVTAAEAASIVSTRDKLGRLSSVDELVVHGDLTLETADRLREYAVFIG